MRTMARECTFAWAATMAACGDDGAGTGGSTTGVTGVTAGPTSTPTSAPAPTEGSSGEGVDATGPAPTSGEGTGTSGGLKLDVGGAVDFGDDETGEVLPLTCENIALQPATSVGCEFWGVDLPMLQYNELAYGISVGNPTDEVATVTIEDMRGPGDTLRMITQLQLAPKASELIEINGTGGILPGDHAVAGNGLTPRGAFRVRSDVPITAMQINPVGGGPSHVAEASLLLPSHALGQSYFALDYATEFGAWVVVVALADATTVTTLGGDVMLDAFDTWAFVPGDDPTGFFVGSDRPVAVFSGNNCVLIPGQPWYACDHLEEQVIPAAAWGTRYVGARHPQRVPQINPTPEEVRWRLVAGVDGTTITLQPPQPGVGGQAVIAQAGAFVEFASTESFVATGDQPFMLVQFMTGCYNVIKTTGQPQICDQGPTGDPYMIQVPPIDQWLTELPFLTDTSYPRDFVIVTREAGTKVQLACLGEVTDDHFTAVPGTPYEVGYVELDDVSGEGDCADGAQLISADRPIGVMVAGLDWATSYGYPGGLNFKALWDPPDVPPQ
jgi:hypothetical protein